jgi:hypothetical protein
MSRIRLIALTSILTASILLGTARNVSAASSGPAAVIQPGSQPGPATIITTYVVTCTSLTIQRTTDPNTPYVHIVLDDDTYNNVVNAVLTVNGSTFSYSTTFPTITGINYLAAVGYDTPSSWNQHNYSAIDDSSNYPCPISWSMSRTGGASPIFTDGRLNDNDPGQTAAIYCENKGITVYGFYHGISFVAFKASTAEINKVPEHPTVNTLIKQGHGIRLYRLTGGQFQINAPDGYVFIWTADCTK